MARQTGVITQEPELSSDPATPPSGYVITYTKTDGKRYMKRADGAVTEIGAGAAPASGGADLGLVYAMNNTRYQ